MTISAIIRTLNEGEHLPRLLDCLADQTTPVDEVILVDSGSTDNTIEIAERYNCRILQIKKAEFSFGRALNFGCSAATGDVLVILSAHVYPIDNQFIENLVAPITAHDSSITYGRQVGDSRTKFSEARIMLKWFPAQSDWDQRHPFSNNANAAVKRSLWQSLRYDESLTGLEDLDFANRALNLGHKLSYVAEAPIVHVHEETWAGIRNRYRREAIAYSRIFGKTRMNFLKATGLAILNILSDYLDALRSKCFQSNIGSIPKFRISQFMGAWEGFRMHGDVSPKLLERFYYPPSSRASGRETVEIRLDRVS